MARALIIGYGNPLRGDDGLGPRAAEALAPLIEESAVGLVARQQLTPELAEPISRAEWVIFIDAEDRAPAGEIRCRDAGATSGVGAVIAHHLTPARLLGCARELYGRAPEAVVFSVSGEHFGLSEELSPDVAKALPLLIGQVSEWVRRRKEEFRSRSGSRSEADRA